MLSGYANFCVQNELLARIICAYMILYSKLTHKMKSSCTGSQLSTAGLPISYKVGPLWNAVITRSDFKTEAIFGFPSPNYTCECT